AKLALNDVITVGSKSHSRVAKKRRGRKHSRGDGGRTCVTMGEQGREWGMMRLCTTTVAAGKCSERRRSTVTAPNCTRLSGNRLVFGQLLNSNFIKSIIFQRSRESKDTECKKRKHENANNLDDSEEPTEYSCMPKVHVNYNDGNQISLPQQRSIRPREKFEIKEQRPKGFLAGVRSAHVHFHSFRSEWNCAPASNVAAKRIFGKNASAMSIHFLIPLTDKILGLHPLASQLFVEPKCPASQIFAQTVQATIFFPPGNYGRVSSITGLLADENSASRLFYIRNSCLYI
ncbi:hypothetical protein ALC53_06413, partial [Atta colombica]